MRTTNIPKIGKKIAVPVVFYEVSAQRAIELGDTYSHYVSNLIRKDLESCGKL